MPLKRSGGCGPSCGLVTISDLVIETHDTHHPISSWLYYEQQKPEAKRRTKEFWRHRGPKFLGYFERLLQNNGGQYLVGRRLTYVRLITERNTDRAITSGCRRGAYNVRG